MALLNVLSSFTRDAGQNENKSLSFSSLKSASENKDLFLPQIAIQQPLHPHSFIHYSPGRPSHNRIPTSRQGIVHSLRPIRLRTHCSPRPVHSDCPSEPRNRLFASSTAAPPNAAAVSLTVLTKNPSSSPPKPNIASVPFPLPAPPPPILLEQFPLLHVWL